ncbi:MAG TPA: HPP family protein [Silvibacterium sp.]|nr:HPP family protein [Silvibacterium sp.]
MSKPSRKDFLIAPACEGALLLVVGLAGWATHHPLVFASLGPTAFELIEAPKRPSAKPYNVIVGHLIGVLAGFTALIITHAWWAPVVSSSGVPLARVWAGVIAAVITVAVTLLARATQPAAVATTLLVSLGMMQMPRDGVAIMCAVVLMTLIGEPLRRWRVGTMPEGGE